MSNKTKIVNIRFAPEEKEILERKSKREGLTKSAYIRSLVIKSRSKSDVKKETDI